MSIISFAAKVISAERNSDEQYYMVGFADHKYDYQNYIICQKAFKNDAQDIKSGIHGHYLEVNGQENSAYRCCEKILLDNTSIQIFTIPEKLNNIEKIIIDTKDVKVDAKFLKYLNAIFGDIVQNNIS